MDGINFTMLLVSVPPILLALTLHEYAHGWVAYQLGDPTAKLMGRLTLNPLAHLDPFGTLMIFLVRFGWAKPVPVDPRYLQNPKRDMMWIAAAGPGMNMILALASGILLRIMMSAGMTGQGTSTGALIFMMVYLSVYINLALAVFNIIPLPPLDGSRILAGLLPNRYAPTLRMLEMRGPMILMGVILLGMFTNFHIIGMVIRPFVNFFMWVFAGI
ncbi:MAG: site-2 protease family protein [Candidatus Marinimicrobia bacterium]|nr:site-2 protease family protein [Candidatus Neomarinimicrobiota bacterium]MCF7840214.1 site-2 protease family protein [Candidatus Neomarinimicrobiota bacterium]